MNNEELEYQDWAEFEEICRLEDSVERVLLNRSMRFGHMWSSRIHISNQMPTEPIITMPDLPPNAT